MKIGVIADDLTGGNGTGVRLTKLGFRVATMVSYDRLPSSDSIDAVIVDSDSRYAREDIAQMRVQKAIENLTAKWGASILCKRIDSTMRGNIGIELDTLLSDLGPKAIAVVVPAFPDSGRTVSGGYLLVNGVPLQATDVANDPVKPITQSYVPEIVQKQSNFPVSYISLEAVLAGKDKLKEVISENINLGKRILTIDAITNEDIETIAGAMAEVREYRMIPADPGPLTAAYAKAHTSQHQKGKKIIVSVGSVTTNALKQLQYLITKTNVQPVYVDAKKLVTQTQDWDEEIERVVHLALEKMVREDILIIATLSPLSEQLNLKAIATEQQVDEDFLAKRIADGLGKITQMLTQNSKYEIGGFFTCGGDVTASLCSIGKVEGIKLEDEVLPLAAHGRLIGGYFDGISLVTKGGMAGDKEAIYESVKYLLAKSKGGSGSFSL